MKRAKKSNYRDVKPEFRTRLDAAYVLREEAEKIVEAVRCELLREILTDLGLSDKPQQEFSLSFLSCTGKYGACIYDNEEDISHDDCLVCHEPYERK